MNNAIHRLRDIVATTKDLGSTGSDMQDDILAICDEVERLTAEGARMKAAIDEAIRGYDMDCYCCDPSPCCDRISSLMSAMSGSQNP